LRRPHLNRGVSRASFCYLISIPLSLFIFVFSDNTFEMNHLPIVDDNARGHQSRQVFEIVRANTKKQLCLDSSVPAICRWQSLPHCSSSVSCNGRLSANSHKERQVSRRTVQHALPKRPRRVLSGDDKDDDDGDGSDNEENCSRDTNRSMTANSSYRVDTPLKRPSRSPSLKCKERPLTGLQSLACRNAVEAEAHYSRGTSSSSSLRIKEEEDDDQSLPALILWSRSYASARQISTGFHQRLPPPPSQHAKRYSTSTRRKQVFSQSA